MSFFSRLFSRKEAPSRILIAQHNLDRPVTTPRDYEKLSEEGYSKNAVAYACVNKIATSLKTIRLVLYRKPTTPKGRLEEVESHPILKLLERPNPMMAGPTYWEAVAAYMLLSGNSYTHAVGPQRDSAKNPRELWPLRPDRVQVIPGRTGLPKGYEYSSGASKVIFPVDVTGAPSQVLHIKSFNPLNDWYGMSPIEAAAFSIDQHNESGKWNLALLQNSARPSGILTLKQKLKDEVRDKLRDDLESRVTGAQNAGKPIVINGAEAEWTGLSFTPEAMEWIESKNTSARDIALVFNVPPMLLGIPGDNTYSNYKEAREAFWIEGVLPLVDGVLGGHNAWLPALFGDDRLMLGYDKDELDALAPTRQAVWDKVTTAEHITINEKRAATGYEELSTPEADEVFISAGKIPLSFSDELSQPLSDSDFRDEQGEGDVSDLEDDDDSKENISLLETKARKRSTRERKRLWLKLHRKRIGHERRFMRQLAATFEVEAKRVADAVDGLLTVDQALRAAEAEIRENQHLFERVIQNNLKLIAEDFGGDTLNSFKASNLKFETKDANIRFESFLTLWIKNNVGRRVSLIVNSTKRKITQAIQDAFLETVDAGEGTAPFAKRIMDAYKGFTKTRATLIARTETASASNAAAEAAAKATGVPNLKKEWISSADDRSRDGSPESTNHRAMDGVQVGIDEKFLVPSDDGPDEMDRPGDPEAPVDQIANCRCILGFVSEDD